MQGHHALLFAILVNEENLFGLNIFVYTGPLFFGGGGYDWTAGYGNLLCDR